LGRSEVAMLHSESDWPKTLEEFRAWHERQPDVWEFIDGVPKLIAPGSMAHTLIKSNIHAALAQAVQGTGCRAQVDGAIIEVEGSSFDPGRGGDLQRAGFHDAADQRSGHHRRGASPSNEKDDVGRKLALYLKIPSLRHYLVIHQDRRQTVHHQRRDDLTDAFLTTIAPPDPLRLDPPGVEIALAAIYEGVPVTAAEPGPLSA
jgi:hypothetical protein